MNIKQKNYCEVYDTCCELDNCKAKICGTASILCPRFGDSYYLNETPILRRFNRLI